MASPAKPEPGKTAAPEGAAAAPVAERKAGGGWRAWIPAAAAIVLGPVATWAAVEYVVVPRLTRKIAEAARTAAESPPNSAAPKGPAAAGKAARDPQSTYEFQNVVVNLAGTMGTRYLKTTLVVTGVDPSLKSTFDAAKPQLTDVTLNVLSSLSLADLEEPGAKNIIREKLVTSYNQALGRKVAAQVYFSDFVIQ